MHTDPEAEVRCRQPLKFEALRFEPFADLRYSVGCGTVPGPDDGSAGLAQLTAAGDGVLDVSVGDVAEDAADEDEIRRGHVLVPVDQGGVTSHHVHVLQAGPAGLSCGGCSVARIQLDELRPNIVAAGVLGQNVQKIAALPGAKADHPQITFRGTRQGSADLGLNRL